MLNFYYCPEGDSKKLSHAQTDGSFLLEDAGKWRL